MALIVEAQGEGNEPQQIPDSQTGDNWPVGSRSIASLLPGSEGVLDDQTKAHIVLDDPDCDGNDRRGHSGRVQPGGLAGATVGGVNEQTSNLDADRIDSYNSSVSTRRGLSGNLAMDEPDLGSGEQVEKPHEKEVAHEAHKPSVGLLVGSEGKSPLVAVSANKSQQLQKPTKARWPELYRYEIEFRPSGGGHKVLIRKRLRFTMSAEMGKVRTSRTVVTAKCPQLTAEMVQQIKDRQFTAAALEALSIGGIGYGIVEGLISRPGSGRHAETRQLEEPVKLAVIRLLRQSLSVSRVTDIAAHRRKLGRR